MIFPLSKSSNCDLARYKSLSESGCPELKDEQDEKRSFIATYT